MFKVGDRVRVISAWHPTFEPFIGTEWTVTQVGQVVNGVQYYQLQSPSGAIDLPENNLELIAPVDGTPSEPKQGLLALLTGLLPMLPQYGPPLPALLGLRWPWVKG